MKKLLLATTLMFSTSCFAGYTSNAEIQNVYVNNTGEVLVGFVDKPAGTCSLWGWHIKFDATTEGGSIMYSTLLSAKAMKQKVNVWYTDSSVPGSDQSNGCKNTVTPAGEEDSTMAKLDALSLP